MEQNQWGRETAPPIRHRPPNPDPFNLRWVAVELAESVLRHLRDPHRRRDPSLSGSGRPERVEWMPDEGFTPLQLAWVSLQIEDYCSRRGRPIVLVDRRYPPPAPTPGELLASSMSRLPALPPTAGGLMPPAKA